MVVWSRRDGVKGNWPFCIQVSAALTADKSQRSKPSIAGVSWLLLLLSSRQLLLNTGRKLMVILMALFTQRRQAGR